MVFSTLKEWEIIFVDNGSLDGSDVVLTNLTKNIENFKILTIDKNIGYGHGIVSGLKAATGDIIGWTHADMQTNPKDCLRISDLFTSNPEGSFIKGKRGKRPFLDIFFTTGMSIFESLLLKKVLFDINAQPNFFHKNFFKSLKNPPNDFSLDLFFYFYAKHKKLRIIRFPVTFSDRMFGISHWNIDFRSKMKFIKRTVLFSLELKRLIKNADS
tara:strand:- start:1010 stop:1648 length:639 start_codon:yes stop_codon:yes gene_type:complete